jgi:hypothetical protein
MIHYSRHDAAESRRQMNEPATTNLKTSLAHRTAIKTALTQIIQLNKMLAIDLRRYQGEPSCIDLDLAHDLGLTLQRALDRAYDRSFDE